MAKAKDDFANIKDNWNTLQRKREIGDARDDVENNLKSRQNKNCTNPINCGCSWFHKVFSVFVSDFAIWYLGYFKNSSLARDSLKRLVQLATAVNNLNESDTDGYLAAVKTALRLKPVTFQR